MEVELTERLSENDSEKASSTKSITGDPISKKSTSEKSISMEDRLTKILSKELIRKNQVPQSQSRET